MDETFSIEDLAETVNRWCEEHQITPASGQAGERLTVRNVRYYRTLGLLDPPVTGGGHGFAEKHRLQLAAIRLLQAQGLPLSRIQGLLFGRSVEELKRIEKQGLAELAKQQVAAFYPGPEERWCVTPLDDEFMLVSRRGRGIGQQLRQRVLSLLQPNGYEQEQNALKGGHRTGERKSE